MTGRSLSAVPRSMLRDRAAPNSSGLNSGPKINAEITVRRSRRFSRNSLRKTLRIACMRGRSVQRLGSLETFCGADQAHEGVLQVARSRALAQLLGRAARHHGTVSDDDHRVAQRADLLHHVAREQHAV